MSERIEFSAESVEVRPDYSTRMTVEVEVSDFGAFLEGVENKDIVETIGNDDLLDIIGIEAAKEYWDLVERPED